MSNIREFEVNKYLKLVLRKSQERDETIIYVAGKEFMQCRYLLLQVPRKKIDDLNTIESIDEVAERLDKSQERNLSCISAEEEFFGHCSNLQAWYDYGYDTMLLHRNMAFTLLKELSDVGDVQAKKVFKEEIGKRLTSGFDSVVLYLLEEGYIIYLSLEELESLTLGLAKKSKEVLVRCILKVLRSAGMEHILKEKLFGFLKILNINLASDLEYVEYNGERFYVNKCVLEIHATKDETNKIEKISDIINLEKFSNLKQLNLSNQKIKKIEGLESLKNLEVLNLGNNQIKEIKGLENLENIKELFLDLNEIREIKGLENLTNLQCLSLSGNQISEIKRLENLTNLEYLNLHQNKIIEIKGLDNLINLKYLILSNNKISIINGLKNLTNLENLDLSDNRILETLGLENLRNLRDLNLLNNNFSELKGIENLKILKTIHLNLRQCKF